MPTELVEAKLHIHMLKKKKKKKKKSKETIHLSCGIVISRK
jgi:hypothetical protein